MSLQFYGIPNCDTVKKARKWLEAQGIDYTFHDFKKDGAEGDKVAAWIADKGLDVVLNKRGTTFRKLSNAEKEHAADPAFATGLMVANPSMIKRPVLEYDTENGAGVLIGFKPADWEAVLC